MDMLAVSQLAPEISIQWTPEHYVKSHLKTHETQVIRASIWAAARLSKFRLTEVFYLFSSSSSLFSSSSSLNASSNFH